MFILSHSIIHAVCKTGQLYIKSHELGLSSEFALTERIRIVSGVFSLLFIVSSLFSTASCIRGSISFQTGIITQTVHFNTLSSEALVTFSNL